MKITLEKNNEVICTNAKWARAFFERLQGLMGVSTFSDIGCDGLMIEKCNSIHTFFMKMSIDVLFLSSDNRIVGIVREMKPWRLTRFYFDAVKVLELPAKSLNSNLLKGQKVTIHV